MHRSKNIFAKLAARVETGDAAAQAELGKQLEPEMIRVVRRVVQTGASRSSMDRRILAEARRVGLDAELARCDDGEQLIRSVARSVSSLLVDLLRARQPDHFARKDTVCNA